MTTASVRDSNIIAALADGKTTRQVADTFGLTTFKVVQVASAHGVVIDGDGHAKDTPALHAAANANGHKSPPLPDSADPAALLDRALTHPAARIRVKAARARDLLAEIAQALHAEAERDLARTRIAKLEKELAAEKALLRGASNPAVRPRRQPGGTLPCPDCDNLFTSPQGVILHRVKKHGYRAGGAA